MNCAAQHSLAHPISMRLLTAWQEHFTNYDLECTYLQKNFWSTFFLSTALWILFQEFWISHDSADLNKMFDLIIETSSKIFPKRPNYLNDLRPNLICVRRILRSNNWCLISPSVWIRSHPWSFPDCLSRTIHPSLSSIFYQLWASLQSKPRLNYV